MVLIDFSDVTRNEKLPIAIASGGYEGWLSFFNSTFLPIGLF
ncbi:hypothetical protein VCRA2122O339_120069 [Vibrio crassostreae]|nr:hypothetical protein VCRA2120E331_120069 [Vibrio crassostreae]CAK3173422.1 hypothetical protein VCRA2127O345_120069 [Vibrio crassostreae]CAK3201464.1 hypothetical protein VCRA2120E330_130092 [Vibrio crassostreae]CAK3209032.1 hypothetical protein VCRA2122O339_120069 [Vibrio crassostreae]CAK3210925.1 hypothetical protein VCRA2122O338_120069 [Vibrio crassostreae]